MTKRLIIARHGNTFLPEQTPTRVGRNTDLPLVEEQRGRAIGKYLLSRGIALDKAYAAPLKRTMGTAQLALEELDSDLNIIPIDAFVEVDYGPDENKTENEVMMRLGREYVKSDQLTIGSEDEYLKYGKNILKEWDAEAIVPQGWQVDAQQIIEAWHSFAAEIGEGETVLLCSSNGIIRFAPHILAQPYDEFCQQHEIKVATGSVSIFEEQNGKWMCSEWNSKPYKDF